MPMSKEELEKVLEEHKDMLPELSTVTELVTGKVDEAVSGLKRKNKELLGSVKTKQEQLKEYEDKLEELENKGGDSKDIDKIRADLQAKYQQKESELQQKLDNLDKQYKHTVLDKELTTAFQAVEISAPYAKAAKHLLLNEYGVDFEEDDNGTPKATVNNKPVHEFVKEWAGTDEGKAFIKPATNSGGGGTPGKAGQGGANGKAFADWSNADKAEYIRENGQSAYSQLVAENSNS
jgi:hypothetical protein